MKAIVSNQKIYYTDFPLTKLKKEWVRIKVDYVGLCGSDVQKLVKIKNTNNEIPAILGHEFIGEVIEINSESTEINIGDKVAGIPLLPCYKCVECNKGLHNLCRSGKAIGRTDLGAFAEFVDIPLENAIPINNISLKNAVLADALAVCLHAINKIDKPVVNTKCLVIGDGTIGSTLALTLKLKGARVSLLGRHVKENIKLSSVAVETYSSATELPMSTYDIVFETVGRKQHITLENAIYSVAPAGTIIVLGVYEPEYAIPLKARDLFIKEATLLGANSYIFDDFYKALQMLEEYTEYFSSLITHTLPLSEFNRGLNAMIDKKEHTIKVVYQP
ncbi:zinc-dependent alcohol dehydrogenase [Bacillus pseudomycoides]|uniref:zinc-dependent alcohol dehydrogenase n=1 Tax=Bacillus pseudomycoides TaxID=64104 RepID=UPI000BEC58A9|nr:alcohol dehydrogenase catalytic domain-containing protein [Bacillus pseudomycoides]PDZ70802.1 hypothetical protein CON58_26920 [Bacillus pseudomycoides]